MSDFTRAILNSLLPKNGSCWKVKQDDSMDNLFEGISDNAQEVINFSECLTCLRDPFKTTFLSDLEKEYGIQTDNNLTENIRRSQLSSVIYRGDNNGSKDDLQNALQNAGFNVKVHENSPAVDPDIFLNSIPFMVADGDNAHAGFYPTTPGVYTSIAGKTGGELLINGKVYEQRPDYISVADGDYMFAGNSNAYAGKYSDLFQEDIIYPIPDDPDSWPFFFFIGGDATRDLITGELLTISSANVYQERKSELTRIILKYKPLHTWAGLIINYI